jgi:hypothetical protein
MKRQIDFYTNIFIAILTLGPMIYCVVTGIRLWLKRPNSVKLAKIFLIINLCINLITVGLAIIGGDKLSNNIAYVARFIISFIIWYSYLSVSIRVRNTYSNIKEGSGATK